MAVTGISHKEAVERQNRLEAWSGVITWSLYGLLAALVLAVTLVLVEGRRKENRLAELRSGWDKYYLAFKDKQAAAGRDGLGNDQRIPILEGLWADTKGTPVQPFVAMELAQCHYQEAVEALRDPNTGRRTLVEDAIKYQRAEFEKALKVFDTVCQHWSDNPAYGPLAFEGAALCQEQMKDYTAAINTLEKGVKKYSKHFLVDKMRYELARNYWLRALRKEAEDKDGAEDRSRALEHVARVVSEVDDADASPMSWRHDARYLRSLLQKPGNALGIFPDGKPPARPEPKKVPEKADDTKPPAKADDTKTSDKSDKPKKPEVPKKPDKPEEK